MQQGITAQCLFCQKYKLDGSFSLVLSKALYCKYSQSQNFYYQRDVNDILDGKNVRAKIRYIDINTFDQDGEYLRRFYKQQESETRIPNLLEYYKYHINIPRNFYSTIINRRMEKVRNICYRKIKQELGLQNEVQPKNQKQKDSSDDCSVAEMKNLLKDLKLESTQPDYSKITNSTILKDLITQIGNCNEIIDPFDFLEPKMQIRITNLPLKHQTPSNSIKINIEKQIKTNQYLKAPYQSRYPKLTSTNNKPPTVKIVISQQQNLLTKQQSQQNQQQSQPQQQLIQPQVVQQTQLKNNKGSLTTRVKSRQASMGNLELAKSGHLTSRSNYNNNNLGSPTNETNEALMEFAIKMFSNQTVKATRKTPFAQNNNFFVKGNNSPQFRALPTSEEFKLQFRSLRSKLISPTRQSKSNVSSPMHKKKQQQ